MKKFCALVLCALFPTLAVAQQPTPPKPGPEHAILKKMEGTWELTMREAGKESKGTATYQADLGGLYLAGEMKSEVNGAKFQGKSLDTYDIGSKKYIGVWACNFTTRPMLTEGTYDAAKKTLTMIGEGPGPDGNGGVKQVKWRSETIYTDNDTVDFKMYMADGKEPSFTITYKRKN